MADSIEKAWIDELLGNPRKHIGLKDIFILKFKVKSNEISSLWNLEKDNPSLFKNMIIGKTAFNGFSEIKIPVNLIRAEQIRQLLKHIRTYE